MTGRIGRVIINDIAIDGRIETYTPEFGAPSITVDLMLSKSDIMAPYLMSIKCGSDVNISFVSGSEMLKANVILSSRETHVGADDDIRIVIDTVVNPIYDNHNNIVDWDLRIDVIDN